MDNKIVIVFFALFAFMIGIIGHSMGSYEMKEAIKECEKTLPRNVNCTIIAVPVDKN